MYKYAPRLGVPGNCGHNIIRSWGNQRDKSLREDLFLKIYSLNLSPKLLFNKFLGVCLYVCSPWTTLPMAVKEQSSVGPLICCRITAPWLGFKFCLDKGLHVNAGDLILTSQSPQSCKVGWKLSCSNLQAGPGGQAWGAFAADLIISLNYTVSL